MRTTKRERTGVINRLSDSGISIEHAKALRRIAMTLHSWFEKECGDDNGCIERDEETGKTYWLSARTNKRFAIADRERGAEKRLDKIMKNYPDRHYYIQGDCRGASLYILRKTDVREGESIDSVYTRGVAVY